MCTPASFPLVAPLLSEDVYCLFVCCLFFFSPVVVGFLWWCCCNTPIPIYRYTWYAIVAVVYRTVLKVVDRRLSHPTFPHARSSDERLPTDQHRAASQRRPIAGWQPSDDDAHPLVVLKIVYQVVVWSVSLL